MEVEEEVKDYRRRITECLGRMRIIEALRIACQPTMVLVV